MPDGLTDTLTRGELLDLARFLSELGKGPYAPYKARLVRRWQAAEPVASGGRTTLAWVPVYSMADGSLPLHELPRLAAPKRGGGSRAISTSFGTISRAAPAISTSNGAETG